MSASNSAHTHFEVLFALVTHLHPAHLAHQHILTVVQHPLIYSVYLQAASTDAELWLFLTKDGSR